MRLLPASLRSALAAYLRNDPAIFGLKPPDPMDAGRLRALQVQSLLRYTPYMLLANVLNSLIFLLSARDSGKQGAALLFTLGICGLVGFLYLRWKQAQNRPPRTSASVRAPRRAVLNALMLGSVWAIPPLFFVDVANPAGNLLVASLSVGMMCGGAFALAAVPAAAAAFVLPIAAGSVVGTFYIGVEFAPELASLLMVFLFVIIKSTGALSAMIAERMLGEFEQERQRETIGILLGEFEENASDWLWEADADGAIVYVSPGFYKAIGASALETSGMRGLDLLREHDARDNSGSNNMDAIKACWRDRKPFRDVEIGILTPAGRRYWCLTGRPIFDHAQEFRGYRGFCADATERREHEDRISHLARYDSVTGLANRVLFGELLADALRNAAAQPFNLFCIDLDGFKEVNDTFGHAVGDRLLREVGDRIRMTVGSDGNAARLGGDEFAVILNSDFLVANAGVYAEALIHEISQTYAINGFAIHIGASIGIVLAPAHGEDAERLLINADLALYRAKSSGKGTWRIFEVFMDEEARARRSLEEDLRRAVANHEFRLVFQPVVSLADRGVDTCEALIRWRHPERGEVPPAEFIPLAEETGLIFGIGEWVIDEACRIASGWPRQARVAVNLSPAQFHSQGLLPAIRQSLARHALSPERLEIEVTESVLVSNVERVQLVLDALSALGVRIALDDFGTGYSSLGYIRQIRFDKIKIDRSFVHELSTDRKCAAIVRAVIALAHDLDMRVTAEGVETAEQAAFLEREGCMDAQGYFFSRPVEACDAPKLFQGPSKDRSVAA